MPGTPSPFWPSANIQAASTIRAGLINSDGWKPNGPMASQRVAPLASLPKKGSRHITPMQNRKVRADTRRTWRGDSIEVEIRMPRPRVANAIMRQA